MAYLGLRPRRFGSGRGADCLGLAAHLDTAHARATAALGGLGLRLFGFLLRSFAGRLDDLGQQLSFFQGGSVDTEHFGYGSQLDESLTLQRS